MVNDQGRDRIQKGWLSNFFQTPNRIYDMDLSGYAKAVYVYLCRCADAAKQCYPSYAKMAKDIGFSRSTMRRAVTDLITHQLLVVEHRRRDGGDGEYTSNLYTLVHPDDAAQMNEVGSDRTYPVAPAQGRVHESTPVVSETIPKVHETTGGTGESTEEYSLTIPTNKTHDNNTQTRVVVEDVRRSIESILGVSVKTLTDLPKWIDTYGTDYLVAKATIVANDPPRGGWKNVVGAYRSAVLGNWAATTSSAQLDVGGQEPPLQYDIRYHNYYLACEREQYLSYCHAHPEYVAQLIAQYGRRVLADMPGLNPGGDADVALRA